MIRKRQMWKEFPRTLACWQGAAAWSLCFEGDGERVTVTWFCADDIHQRERTYNLPLKIDAEIELPKWPWRPFCWLYGHEEHYGYCITCEKPMPESIYYKAQQRRKK